MKNQCHNCGQDLGKEAIFCGACGTKVSATETTSKGSVGSRIWAYMSVVALLPIIAIGWFALETGWLSRPSAQETASSIGVSTPLIDLASDISCQTQGIGDFVPGDRPSTVVSESKTCVDEADGICGSYKYETTESGFKYYVWLGSDDVANRILSVSASLVDLDSSMARSAALRAAEAKYGQAEHFGHSYEMTGTVDLWSGKFTSRSYYWNTKVRGWGRCSVGTEKVDRNTVLHSTPKYSSSKSVSCSDGIRLSYDEVDPRFDLYSRCRPLENRNSDLVDAKRAKIESDRVSKLDL